MKKIRTLFTFMLLSTSCSTVTATRDVSISDATSNSPTRTSIDSTSRGNTVPSPTAFPSEPSIIPSISGAMSHNQMQDRINDWVSGEIIFNDQDRLLDEDTSEALNLGLYRELPANAVIFIFYNLGYTLVADSTGEVYVINIVGFEDSQGQRFAFVFHLGKLSNECQVISKRLWKGNWINHEEQISRVEVTPLELLQYSNELVDHVVSTLTRSDSRGTTGNKCVDDLNHYYASSKATTIALISFFNCSECTIENAPKEINEWANSIPLEYDARIPYLRILDVRWE